jgi:hypothetical protein
MQRIAVSEFAGIPGLCHTAAILSANSLYHRR